MMLGCFALVLVLCTSLTTATPSTVPLTVLAARQLSPTSETAIIGRATCTCIGQSCPPETSRASRLCVAQPPDAELDKGMQPITCRIECCAWCMQHAAQNEPLCQDELVTKECTGEAGKAMGFKGSVLKKAFGSKKSKKSSKSGSKNSSKKSGSQVESRMAFGEFMRLKHEREYREYSRKNLIHRIEQDGLIRGGATAAAAIAKVAARAGLDKIRSAAS